ncbi:hypothetical protein BaRGS_00028024 [Batillaria attramentaria]|uniref:Uncharacterized protein n=1 Tax=Batillaria attramentaria TaxID=370345 RepID=A0ABD0K1N7_9CAEN
MVRFVSSDKLKSITALREHTPTRRQLIVLLPRFIHTDSIGYDTNLPPANNPPRDQATLKSRTAGVSIFACLRMITLPTQRQSMTIASPTQSMKTYSM